jgi:hypothetical protein
MRGNQNRPAAPRTRDNQIRIEWRYHGAEAPLFLGHAITLGPPPFHVWEYRALANQGLLINDYS